MKNRFLGFISLLYAFIIIYLCLSNNLNNVLAPQMQVYTKLSIVPLILIGFVFISNKQEFKKYDLVLLIPLIMLILSGDFRLSIINSKELKIKKEVNLNEKEDNIDTSTYNFDNVDFDIVDASYASLSDYFNYTTNTKDLIGKTVRFKGLSIKNSKIVDKNKFVIGKYLITCCAADAGFIGFIVDYDKSKVKDNTWYQVEGVLKRIKLTDGSYVVGVEAVNVKEIDSKSEEQYVYPCYTYSDTCSEVSKYNLK